MKRAIIAIVALSISIMAYSQISKNPGNIICAAKQVNEPPLVCTLAPGPEQAERQRALKKEIFSQVKKTEEVDFGYSFYFEYDEAFLMKMTDYVIAENNCCPFLTFETKLHSTNDAILTVTGPSQEAKEMIKIAFSL